ncbi:MAG: hypothetical protein II570_06900, partial [Bacteroidaceae bacterium]|nr:hypothetical protein [Bacteroidaceae bacterium]
PPKNIYEGTFVGYVHTYDGQRFPMPELTYEQASNGGHFEIQKTIIWKNDGVKGTIDWGNVNCRFAMDGHDGNNECVATFPEDVWEKMKTGTFYALCRPDADWYQIRITNGWWDTQWMGADNDISPNNMADRMIDNGDGTFYIEINFGDDPIVGTLDEKHLLFTGSGYTLLEIYFEEEVWIEGDEPSGDVKNTFWKNDGVKGTIDWGNVNCRFALDGHDGNNECVATFPEDVWTIIKTGTFYALCRPDADWYQIRITNGWWDTQWMGADNDISPNNMSDRIIDNGDGTFYIEINFGDDPIVGTLDDKHLLFTGSGYTLLELYFIE